ncbi:SCO1664 family protein [Candidatus Planktophila versatilis]|uniref:SCO1664 family protein n=1 Tax=Candidatus Planktophila versatilis TaxID=1884905 RepID=UPI001CC15D25|nr:SCO1664 family protein [Candidatus Planktophila versatilis]
MSALKWLSQMSKVIEHLLSGTLEVTGRLVDASNATLYGECTFSDEKMAVIYKPIAGERPLWDFPDGNLAHREYASYLISEYSGWKVVPPTVLREGPFGLGMVQQWIDIDESIDLALYYREDNENLRRMALFDAVINNTDRKIGHLLPVVDGSLLGCDHGVTFHEENKLRTVIWQFAERELTAEEIHALDELVTRLHTESEVLRGLITEIEFSALIARIEGLMESGKFPSPSEDWPAVPWPPF